MVTKPRFKFIAGALCVDFLNTVGGRIGTHGAEIIRDKLTDFDSLVEWSQAAGILTRTQAADLVRREAADVFHRAVAVREAFYRVCRACVDQRTPSAGDLDTLNRELAAARGRQRLRFSHGTFVSVWDQADAPDRILWTVVCSAAEFLESSAPAALRQCPGEDCGWMFLDTSRNHSRQWCEMRICGNRSKVRRFRERQDGA